MSERPDYDRGMRDGIRWAVAQVHAYASEMNDPSARAALNTAGFTIGQEAARCDWKPKDGYERRRP